MPTAAIYVRVSTEDQAREGVSLSAQQDVCISYCQRNKLDIAAILTEEGESAYSIPLAQRTKGQKLLTLISDGAITDIVSYQLDRIFRNDVEAISYARQWMAAGVSLHFAGGSGEADIGSALGEAFYGFQAIIARMSSRQTSERVSSVMVKILKDGRYPGKAPYGYQLTKNCELIIDEEKAPTLRWIYQQIEEGKTLGEIARDLNRRDIPRPGRAKLWSPAHIGTMLRRRIYMGCPEWGN